jgi:hypothetical protein
MAERCPLGGRPAGPAGGNSFPGAWRPPAIPAAARTGAAGKRRGARQAAGAPAGTAHLRSPVAGQGTGRVLSGHRTRLVGDADALRGTRHLRWQPVGSLTDAEDGEPAKRKRREEDDDGSETGEKTDLLDGPRERSPDRRAGGHRTPGGPQRADLRPDEEPRAAQRGEPRTGQGERPDRAGQQPRQAGSPATAVPWCKSMRRRACRHT